MSTPAQIAANRANAQHSTGPRTDEGKLRASQNALRHGLCASIPIMHDEGDQDNDKLLDALREEFQPVGPNEEILVYKMAEHFFYSKRAAYLLAEQLDSNDTGDDNAREIGLMMRYHTASDRGYYRALTELRKIQQERRCPRVQPDATTYPSAARSETLPPILPTSHVQLGDTGQPRAMERDRSIGSVPSTAEAALEVAPTEPAEPAEIGSVSHNAEPLTAEQPVFLVSRPAKSSPAQSPIEN
jgi:hypothetical protein